MFDYVIIDNAKLYIIYEKSNYNEVKKVLQFKKLWLFFGYFIKIV